MARAAEHSKEKMQSEIHKDQPAGVTNWPVANTRRAVLRRGQYCHKYTCDPRQRVTCNVESTLGASVKSFPFLNKCTDFSIHAHKMSDQDIAQAIYSLQNSPQAKDSGEATSKSSPLARRLIASGPRAGPSRDIERTAEPVVLLDDIRLALPNARYIS